MSHPFEANVELACRAARDAGAAAMRHFRRVEHVRFKGPDQPVTEADLAANRVIYEAVLAQRPGDGWLSEETADSAARLACERVWVVDPIDGTNSFVEGYPEFVVSIGLVERGEVVVGVLYNPATDELFHAARGAGAWLGDQPLRVDAERAAHPRVLLVSRSELARGDFEDYADGWTPTPVGSTAYRMALVAAGRGHLFFSRGPKHEWDVCAASLVVQEAGGLVAQLDGSPMRFNQPAPRFHGVVASDGVALPLEFRAGTQT